MDPIYRSERFTLRRPELSDAEAAADFYRRNQTFLRPYYPTFDDSQFEVNTWRQKIRRYQEETERGQTLRLFLFDPANRIIGVVNFVEMAGTPQFECRVGYALDEQEQGKGMISEALGAAIRYVFGNLKMHRIVAAYMPRNERSARVLRKLGFRVEGYARDYILLNGKWEDHIMTSLINEDWKA